jgi:hypothetical protein
MSSSFDPIAELNGKIVRSRKIDFDELQCISIFGHNETDRQFKALAINDNDELEVNMESLANLTVNENDELKVNMASLADLTVNENDELKVNMASLAGLTVNENDELKVNMASLADLTVNDDDELKVNMASLAGLTVNDDDELKVNNGTGYLTKILTNGTVLQPTDTYDSGTQKAVDLSILIIGQHIHDIIPTILISNNNVDYVGLDTSFYEDVVIGISRQIRIDKFISKHFKLNLTNINASSSTIKVSYTYREH